jgi:AraC-like DNA-binding protein
VARAPTDLTLRAYRGEARAHRHDHHQFVLPLAGRLDLEAEGRGGTVDDVRGALVPAEDTHAFVGRGETRCAILDVSTDVSESLDVLAARSRNPFFTVDPALHHLLRFIALSDTHDSTVEALLLTTAVGAVTEAGRDPRPRQLRRALTFMESRAHAPLGVADIADAAALSESRLRELFRTWLNTSPVAHLTAIRLRRARASLTATDRSITEIARDAGFGDQSAFTRAFRRDTGTTPGAYRAAARRAD